MVNQILKCLCVVGRLLIDDCVCSRFYSDIYCIYAFTGDIINAVLIQCYFLFNVFQRSMEGVSWKDGVTGEEVMAKSGQQTIERIRGVTAGAWGHPWNLADPSPPR